MSVAYAGEAANFYAVLVVELFGIVRLYARKKIGNIIENIATKRKTSYHVIIFNQILRRTISVTLSLLLRQ